MYYEINVALNGSHFFATAERSITSLKALETALKVFTTKFPESEGYSISTSYHPGVSYGTRDIAAGEEQDVINYYNNLKV